MPIPIVKPPPCPLRNFPLYAVAVATRPAIVLGAALSSALLPMVLTLASVFLMKRGMIVPRKKNKKPRQSTFTLRL
jgi:hypothetical protein